MSCKFIFFDGGGGGQSFGAPTQSQLAPNNNSAMPGGGGSGGALLLQALDLVIADTPGRLRVTGGFGGDQNSAILSMGGAGSPDSCDSRASRRSNRPRKRPRSLPMISRVRRCRPSS